MHNEQIFTPLNIVQEILDNISYCGEKIRKKHIVDNSCGKGVFLCEIVRRYINVCISLNLPKDVTVLELETYIHGIEIDSDLCNETIVNLDNVLKEYSIEAKINWDIINCDAMDFPSFDGKMDYVVGNPPYCKVHDLGDKYEKVKKYLFAKGGMTDLYLVFFELGLNMLNDDGLLGYITPNSWLTSKAGQNFGTSLVLRNNLLKIIQFGHEKVFEKADTYTCITILSSKGDSSNKVRWENRETNVTRNVYITDMLFDGKFFLVTEKMESLFKEMYDKKYPNVIKCKNGFATLNDKLFIVDDFVKEHGLCENIIRVIKASNGDVHYFFYPYDEDGKPIGSLLYVKCPELVDYIIEKARKLEVDTENVAWYYYGRTQAINDVKHDKIILNNMIRDRNDLKINYIFSKPEQQGVYSGFYIVGDIIMLNFIERKLKSTEFEDYIHTVGSYKSSGYYSFSTKDVEKYLNFKFKTALK